MSGRIDSPTAPALAAACAAAVLAAGVAAPSTAAGQGAGAGELRPEVGLSGGTLAGPDFDDVGVGGGGELGLRYGLTSSFSVGVLGEASWHGAEGLDGPLRLIGASVEPRYRLEGVGGTRWTPFVSARLGVVRWSVTESADTLTADVRAGGLQAGGVVGVIVALSGSADLEVAARASHLTFGDATVDARLGDAESAFTREGSETSGSLLGLRASLRLRLP